MKNKYSIKTGYGVILINKIGMKNRIYRTLSVTGESHNQTGIGEIIGFLGTVQELTDILGEMVWCDKCIAEVNGGYTVL